MKNKKLYKIHELFNKHNWRPAYAVKWNGSTEYMLKCTCGLYDHPIAVQSRGHGATGMRFPVGFTDVYVEHCWRVTPPAHKEAMTRHIKSLWKKWKPRDNV